MIEIIVVCIIIIAILVSMLRDAKNKISSLDSNLQATKKELYEVKSETDFLSKEWYESKRFKSIGVSFTVKNGENKESEYYIERGDRFIDESYAHDVVSERCERVLDDKGRCITECRHTECDADEDDDSNWPSEPSGMILKTEYEYGDANSKNPTKTLFYDEHGDLDIWLEHLLDDEGRDLAHIRHRTCNSTKDIAYFERDTNGDILYHYEESYTEWAYNLEDIPSKFKQVFKDARPYYEYLDEKYFEDSVGEYPPKASCIKTLKEDQNGSLTQLFERKHGSSIKKGTHYFPNEDNAFLTLVIDEFSPTISVYLDLTKDHKRLISEYEDITIK